MPVSVLEAQTCDTSRGSVLVGSRSKAMSLAWHRSQGLSLQERHKVIRRCGLDNLL